MTMHSALLALAHLARTRGGDTAMRGPAGDSISYARLHHTVSALGRSYRALPGTVGLLGANGIPWAAAYLALLAAGKTVVPLPDFFSRAQLTHIVRDARVGRILVTTAAAEIQRSLGLPVSEVAVPDAAALPPAAPAGDNGGDGRLLIYTSGSTGWPKGACLGAAQVAHSAAALVEAIGARSDDSYLSVLPLSQLLEQICALHAPLLAGVPVVFGGAASGPAPTGAGLAALVAQVRPTLMVLVPQLLAAWVAALVAGEQIAPDSLRVVATGGAPVAVSLAAEAWRRGIPVHEGYGLSECCSVVALNRPGDRAAGTVGRPLHGLEVTLDDGEIVVRGPTVMDGYRNDRGRSPAGVWRTGDLGAFDDQGRLIVHGRKDSMLVTAGGRNIVPEWIEAIVTADPRLAHCILIGTAQASVTAILVPHAAYLADYQAMTPAAVAAHVARLVAAAPAYARPSRSLVVPASYLQRRGLLTGNGRPRRALIAAAFAPRPQPLAADV